MAVVFAGCLKGSMVSPGEPTKMKIINIKDKQTGRYNATHLSSCDWCIYIVCQYTQDVISGAKPLVMRPVVYSVAYPVALCPIRDRIDGYSLGNRGHPHGGKFKTTTTVLPTQIFLS